MGILDITDQYCNQLDKQNQINGVNKFSSGNKLHEQPIVSFVQKNNEQEVLYREEL